MPVPQITCPNCGRTINLENRKEIDLDLIKHAARKGPTTFTELLRLTKLPRKTLSVRLKQLCLEGALVKKDGTYVLNGTAGFGNNGGHLMKGVSRMLSDRRIRTGLMLVAFLLSSSVSGYVLASLMVVKEPEAPRFAGTFTMTLGVNDVSDLKGWSTLIVFNPTEVEFVSAVSGDFLGVDPWSKDPAKGVFMQNSNIGLGKLLLGGLVWTDAGKNGSGPLATIAFGYFADGYALPYVDEGGQTMLLNSQGQKIPLGVLTFG
jgi:hypothetical protein